MTLESLDTYRDRLTAQEYEVSRLMVAGRGINEVAKLLRIGAKRVYALVIRAEEVVGQRLRSERGRQRPWLEIDEPIIDDSPGVSPGVRCPVCLLLEPHRCMEPSEHTYRQVEES